MESVMPWTRRLRYKRTEVGKKKYTSCNNRILTGAVMNYRKYLLIGGYYEKK